MSIEYMTMRYSNKYFLSMFLIFRNHGNGALTLFLHVFLLLFSYFYFFYSVFKYNACPPYSSSVIIF
jgi:hypothetical protein